MAEKKIAAKKTAEKKTAVKKETFKAFNVRVKGGGLNVRKDPEVKDGNILQVLADGSETEVIGIQEGWYQIKEGWIKAEFTERV